MNLVSPSASQPSVPVNSDGEPIWLENNWGRISHKTVKGIIKNLYTVEIEDKVYVAKFAAHYETVQDHRNEYEVRSTIWTVPICVWGVEIPFPIHELIEEYGITVKALDYEVEYAS